MSEERLSDLGIIIAMHYSEKISTDDVFFIQAHQRKLFQPSLFSD